MKKSSLFLVLVAFLTGACGLIEDKDTLPQSRPNQEQLFKSDEKGSLGGG